MAQPACDMVMTWLTSGGHVELPLLAGQNLNEKITVIKEVKPVPISLLSEFSINLCKIGFTDGRCHVFWTVNIAMQLPQRNPETFNKPAATLLVLEILSYRLFSFYRNEQFATKPKTKAEGTVIHQCTQLLSPPDDPTYVMTYIGHSFPQHRQYLCAQGRVLGEFSPEEVTANVYIMVDVLLCNIQMDLKHGLSLQEPETPVHSKRNPKRQKKIRAKHGALASLNLKPIYMRI
ncbi:hypothetical protein L2E82_08484 [Cichorium intybus]|uniref:Uncharacterized protein n=1 Tax=Cichorium intybus TaxID=13427 RepID=A0ACB9G6I0_CICIN|nr:hypothetical protein L2E82_08484 [Cichorium intybus]